MPLVSVRRLTRRFNDLTILNDLNLELHAGTSLAIMGASGSGKSTLLNILGGLEDQKLPSEQLRGEVLVDSQDLLALDDIALSTYRNSSVGTIFQLHYLLPQCTALENTVIPCLASKNSASEDELARARQLLDRVGLSSRLDATPSTLSGGECQRVAIARALIQQPKLLLADEPTGSLDEAAAKCVISLLAELQSELGLSLIMVTHNPQLAARLERQATLEEGRLREVRA